MNQEEILKLLQTKAYDFLRTNEHLKDRILFLCLGGSYSYGTNIETSDVDIRGVALNSEDDILGLTNFEQFQDAATDTTIYSFIKFINLVSDCNPNVIEMLFCKPDQYVYVSDLGRKLLDNRHLFLSKKAQYTFGGYAHAQLNRLDNALANRGNILNAKETQEHIDRSVKNCMFSFTSKYGINPGDIKSYVDMNKDNKPAIFVDFNLKGVELATTKEMIQQMSDILRQYNSSIGARNNKKDDAHLNKHMMHLIRLYIMACEIIETGDLHTYRTDEHSLLMDIRNGKYREANGGVKKEFYDLLKSLEDRLTNACMTSKLQNKIDRTKINALVKYIIKKGSLGNI